MVIAPSHRGNPNLKPAYTPIQMTQHELNEYIKCSQDFFYFCENYCKIMSLDAGGYILFKPRPYQKKFADFILNNRFSLARWPRQSGKSTICAAVITWLTIFQDNHTTLIAAHIHKTAIEIMERVKDMIEYLPLWMKPGIIKWNQLGLELENGSVVVSAATTEKTGRGLSLNFVLWDEAAFLSSAIADKFFTAIYPTLSSGKNTKMAVVSTPNNYNHFYYMYDKAKKEESEFKCMDIEWYEVPGRDDEFKRKTIANIGEARWSQEFEALFLGSESSLISPQHIQKMSIKDPIHTMYNNTLKIFESPNKNHKYFITVDVSRGKGLDNCAVVVFDVTEYPIKVAAHYKDPDVQTLIFPGIINNIGRMYFNADILVEINDNGQQIADMLWDEYEYENLLGCIPKGRIGQQLVPFGPRAKGLKTSKTTKRVGCSNLKSLIEMNKMIICSFDIIQELTNFILTGDSYAASDGNHDDLTMCLVNFSWALLQPYMQNYMIGGIRKNFEEDLKALEEELVPAGFYDIGEDEDILFF